MNDIDSKRNDHMISNYYFTAGPYLKYQEQIVTQLQIRRMPLK